MMHITSTFKTELKNLFSDRSRVPLYIVALFVIYLITLSGTAVINYRNLHTLKQDNDWMARSWEVRRQLKNINVSIVELESDVRGYFISGDRDYLSTWQSIPGRLNEAFMRLENVLRSDPAQAEKLARLRALYELKIHELQESIVWFESGGLMELERRAGLGRSREITAAILRLNTAMQNIEAESIDSRRDHYFRESNEAMWSGVIINGLAILILVLFYRLIGMGVAKQRAVEEQLKAANDNLESIVQIRTSQLSVLSHHLLSVREEEKAKLARELHDELGSSLTAIGMDISSVREKLQATDPVLARQLVRAKQTLVDTIDLKRRIIENLRPSMLDNLGLAVSIRHHCEELGRISGLKYEMDIAEDFNDIDPARAIALFRITQEALNNTIKYAQATLVRITLKRLAAGLWLQIQDDGIGISSEALEKPKSHGLLGMRERTLLLGGRFIIRAGSENRGCVVEVFLPHAS